MWVTLPLSLTFCYINTTRDISFKISLNSKHRPDGSVRNMLTYTRDQILLQFYVVNSV